MKLPPTLLKFIALPSLVPGNKLVCNSSFSPLLLNSISKVVPLGKVFSDSAL